jgi:hypothetical protein
MATPEIIEVTKLTCAACTYCAVCVLCIPESSVAGAVATASLTTYF